MRTRRRPAKALASIGFVAAMLSLGVSASSAKPFLAGGSGSTSTAANTLTVAIVADMTTLDVQEDVTPLTRGLLDNVYEALTQFDAKANVVPDLATSWKNLTPTTWRFNLRPKVTFQDGEKFNAAAAAFSINRAATATASQVKSYYPLLTGAAAKGSTIIVTTSAPDPNLPRELSFLPMVPPNYVTTQAQAYLTKKAIGTGPYLFTSWTPGQQFVMTANPHWWGGKPRYKTVTYKIIPDDNVRVQALRAGEIDFAENIPSQDVTLVPQAFYPPSDTACTIRVNSSSGPFADLRVRQAANYALDRKTMVKTLFGKFARIPDGQLVTPTTFGYNPKLTDYPYDVTKAKSLLAASNYNGAPITFYSYSGHAPGDLVLTLAAADYLQKAGFNIKTTIVPYPTWRTYYFGTPRVDMILVCTSEDTLSGFKILNNLALSNGAQSAYNNPSIDKQILAASTEFNDAKRKKDLQTIWANLKDNAFTIPLASVDVIFGGQKNIYWFARYDNDIVANGVIKKKK